MKWFSAIAHLSKISPICSDLLGVWRYIYHVEHLSSCRAGSHRQTDGCEMIRKLVGHWWNHTAYSFQRLNVCYNNILRRLLRRPRYCSASGLFAECGIPNGKAVIRNLIYKFITRLNESTNDVILAILSSDIRWTSRIRHYWVKTLYVHHDLV